MTLPLDSNVYINTTTRYTSSNTFISIIRWHSLLKFYLALSIFYNYIYTITTSRYNINTSPLNCPAPPNTPLRPTSTLTTMPLPLPPLGSFFYIPQAALAGLIFVAVTNIIAPSEFVEAWIHNRNDFLTMLITFIITLVFDTALGLAAGNDVISLSISPPSSPSL